MPNNYILTSNGNFISEDELCHWGIKGMKWGVRRYQNEDGSLTAAGKKRRTYRSTSIKSALARRSNEKVDKGFNEWSENTKKRDNAIDLGKKANAAKRAYENDPKNKEVKAAYKQTKKDYKKALSDNTTYRKGVVRQEVGRDASRKALSEAKRVQKQLEKDPNNKELQKKYTKLMNEHDVQRASARRAAEVASNRSKKKASMKRAMTLTVKTAAATAAVSAGVYAANRYLNNHNVMINGQPVKLGAQAVGNIINIAKKGKNFMKFI